MTARSDRWLLAWGLAFVAVGAASLLLPLYALSLGGDALLVGLMASTAAFAGVPGAILWGKLVTRTHRRRPFLLVAAGATAVVLAGSAAMPLATRSPWPLLALNAALWFVVAAAAPVLNLIVVDGVAETEWNARIALLNQYQGYGWLGGILLGTVWTAAVPLSPLRSQQLLLGVLAGTTVAAFVLLRLWYPEPVHTSQRRFAEVYERLSRTGWGAGRYVRTVPFGPSRLYWTFRTFDAGRFRKRFESALGVYLVAATLFFLGFSVFFGPLPAFLIDEGLSSDSVFLLFTLSSAGSAVSYGLAGRLATRRDPHSLQTVALACRAVAFPAVAVVTGTLADVPLLVALGGLFGVVGITWALVAVTATGLVTRLAPRQVRSEALGAYTALGSLGGGIGSALGGLAAGSVGYLAAFAAAGGLVLVGGALALFARRAGARELEDLTAG